MMLQEDGKESNRDAEQGMGKHCLFLCLNCRRGTHVLCDDRTNVVFNFIRIYSVP